MHRNQADFTLTFRTLCDCAEQSEDDARLRLLFAHQSDYDQWAERWRARLAREPTDPKARALRMRRVNPSVIPRNHRIEAVIRAAVDGGDFGLFEQMSEALSRPYEAATQGFDRPPAPGERVLRTFCGT